jgi:hypothetical protein
MSLKKGEALITALYVCILDTLRSRLVNETLKYPTVGDFMTAYGDQFQGESHDEKQKLWQFANWSFILFKMVPAKTNKVLAMDVIPKLLEGWSGMNFT